RRPKRSDDARERIGEVLVLAAAEAMARHDDGAAEPGLVPIQGGKLRAFGCGQDLPQRCPAVAVKTGASARPIDGCEPAVEIVVTADIVPSSGRNAHGWPDVGSAPARCPPNVVLPG